MDLSAEDNLRLNVLLHQDLQAVRIDESKMIVYALTGKGEARVELNPSCKDEKYIKHVKALFSTHVMGSPGGYPVYLKRWTRMGQARDASLSQLLLLGETEAVVAAVHAAGLTDELAARAWWCMPTAENARRMLEKQAVAQGNTGKELADFLLEFLPFEEQQRDIIESVRLVLQPGLISEEQKLALWSRANTKRSYYVGFMHALPDNLPLQMPANDLLPALQPALTALQSQANPYAELLLRVLSPAGQAFVDTAGRAMKKPGDQYVVESLLDAIAAYFVAVKPAAVCEHDIEHLQAQCAVDKQDPELAAVLAVDAGLEPCLQAMRILASLGVGLVNPVFARTDAIGSVMRKKIRHITDPVFAQLAILKGAG